MYDLLVVGEINVDLILQGEQIEPVFGQEILVQDALLTLGSSSVIVACGAAALGLRTLFFGLVGDDEFGHFMLRRMREKGVDVSPVRPDPSLRTGLTVSLSTSRDRAMITYMGCISALRGSQVPLELLGKARHLHVGSFFLQAGLRPDLPALFQRAHAYGMTTSLDFGWDPEGRWDGDLEATIPHVDVLLPNETEALHIAGTESVDEALERLVARVPLVVIKLGPEGAIAARGSERARAPALPVQVVDTTGAGDSFNAGFLYGFLKGWPLEHALRLACACGSLSATAMGGTTAQPDLQKAMRAAGLA